MIQHFPKKNMEKRRKKKARGKPGLFLWMVYLFIFFAGVGLGLRVRTIYANAVRESKDSMAQKVEKIDVQSEKAAGKKKSRVKKGTKAEKTESTAKKAETERKAETETKDKTIESKQISVQESSENSADKVKTDKAKTEVREHHIRPESRYYNYVWRDANGIVPDFKVYIYEPKEFNGKTVFVDPGHGNNTSPYATQKREKVYPVEDSRLSGMNTSMVGAKAYDIGVEPRGFANIHNGRETEPEFTLKVGLIVREKLLAKGYRVVMSRIDNTSNISNGARSILAGETADIMVSIHSNGSFSHSSFGTMAFYPGDQDVLDGQKHPGYLQIFGLDVHQESSKKLAEIMGRRVSAAAGLRNMGIFSGVLRIFTYSSIPTCLVEVGFSDNANDAKALIEKKEGIADAISAGVDEYFGR